MSIIATVINDTIKLPAGTHLENGTQVSVLPMREAPATTFAQRYGKFIGIMKNGPTDLAANHDHYLYGTPKREL